MHVRFDRAASIYYLTFSLFLSFFVLALWGDVRSIVFVTLFSFCRHTSMRGRIKRALGRSRRRRRKSQQLARCSSRPVSCQRSLIFPTTIFSAWEKVTPWKRRRMYIGRDDAKVASASAPTATATIAAAATAVCSYCWRDWERSSNIWNDDRRTDMQSCWYLQ